jgi:hypothetical protein
MASSGEEYTFSAQVKCTSGGATFRIYIGFYDSSGSGLAFPYNQYETTGSYQSVGANGVAPSGTTNLIFFFSATDAGTYYIDQMVGKRRIDTDLIVDGAITAAKITAGAISTDKLDVVNMVANDGNYLVSVGWYLTATTTQYPAPTTANFTADGQTHFYRWSGSAWQEIVNIGHKQESSDHFAMRLFSNSGITQNIYSEVYQDGVGVHGLALTSNNAGVGVKGTNTSSAGYGVCGTNLGGGYAIVAQTHGSAATGAPIVLGASGSASAPSHTALKGSMWVTSAGILYINTDGGTTWAKVGSQ